MAEVTKGPQNVNISAFRERLRGGGARPNLYEVVLNLPNGLDFADASGVQDKSRFLVKAAALPASNLGVVEVPYRGRQLKVAGDRTFDTWTVTVLNDTDFKVRAAMEAWTNQINNNYTNIGVQNPDTYQQDAFDTNDTIEEFTVEFQVQWWQAQAGELGGEAIAGANF